MNEAIEERVAKLEAEVRELRSIIGRQKGYSDFQVDPRPVRERVPPEYWAEREARLAQRQSLKPLDSTEAISQDRDER